VKGQKPTHTYLLGICDRSGSNGIAPGRSSCCSSQLPSLSSSGEGTESSGRSFYQPRPRRQSKTEIAHAFPLLLQGGYMRFWASRRLHTCCDRLRGSIQKLANLSDPRMHDIGNIICCWCNTYAGSFFLMITQRRNRTAKGLLRASYFLDSLAHVLTDVLWDARGLLMCPSCAGARCAPIDRYPKLEVKAGYSQDKAGRQRRNLVRALSESTLRAQDSAQQGACADPGSILNLTFITHLRSCRILDRRGPGDQSLTCGCGMYHLPCKVVCRRVGT